MCFGTRQGHLYSPDNPWQTDTLQMDICDNAILLASNTFTVAAKLVVISGHIVAQSGTTIFLVCVAILKGIISSTL